MPFTENFAEFLRTDEFASAGTWSVGPTPINLIFDSGYEAAQLGLIAGIEGARLVALVETASVPTIAHGQTIAIGSLTYTIRGVRPDGTGMTLLVLEESEEIAVPTYSTYLYIVQAYGASPTASPSANRAAFQAAFDDIPATGGALYIPAGTYQIDGQIVVRSPVRIHGDGSSDAYSPQTSGAYANQGNLGATRLQCLDGTIDFFSIQSVGVALRDIHFTCSATASAGCGVQVGNASVPANGFYMSQCSFFGFWAQIKIQQAAGYTIAHSKLYQHVKYGISIESTNNNGDEGDCVITGNSIMSGLNAASPEAGINWTGGGGLKISNNKISREPPTSAALLVSHKKGIQFKPADNLGSGVITIVGNSIEGIREDCILMDTSATATGAISNVNITGNEFNMVASLSNFVLHGVSGPGSLPDLVYFGGNVINGCYSMVKSELFQDLNIGPNTIEGINLGGPLLDIENGINIGYRLNEQMVSNRPANLTLLLDKTGTNYNSNARRACTEKRVVREMPALNLTPTAVPLFKIDLASVGSSACQVEVNFSGFMSGVGAYTHTIRRLLTGSGGTATIATIGTDYFSGTQLLTWNVTQASGVVTIAVTCILAVGLSTSPFAGIGSGEVRMMIDGTVRTVVVA